MGLPTAPFVLVRSGDPVPRWEGPWPVIVKPEAEDASLGIDQLSVLENGRGDLVEVVARVRLDFGGDVLIEAYLPGREFNVGVLGLPEPIALPVAEIVYDVPRRLLADPDLLRRSGRPDRSRIGTADRDARPRSGWSWGPAWADWPSRRSEVSAAATMPGSTSGSTSTGRR